MVAGLLCVIISFVALAVMYKRDGTAQNDERTPALNVVSELIQDLQLDLVEHGELSSELILECINKGPAVTLAATISIESASKNLPFKRLSYEGKWSRPVTLRENGYGVEYAATSTAYVTPSKPGRLRLATLSAPQKPEGNAYMYLCGTEELAIWDLEHTKDDELPFFILKLEIRARGKSQVLRRRYKVGPKSRNDSLRMWRVYVGNSVRGGVDY